MSKSTISTFELFEMFPDADCARLYMEAKRWPGWDWTDDDAQYLEERG